ncbi:hypothetical protein RRG08_001875 [Elysia crispata]|uniref:Uncharacterized protein n=1 Tax=Elysia crispata TaxID=231223 RepID=A0AAE1A407_9GAST|nr:hypothetical protein RRG08_001875 [Elysia crispata]
MMHLEGRREQPSGKVISREEERINVKDWLCAAKGRERLYSATHDLGIHMGIQQDPYEGLRNTLRQDVGHSPAQIMFGRSTRSLLLSKACNMNYSDPEFQARLTNNAPSASLITDKQYYPRWPRGRHYEATGPALTLTYPE